MAYRAGVFLAILVPALALAQAATGTLTIKESTDPNSEPSPIINADECNGTLADNLTFNWGTLSVPSGDSVSFFVSNQSGCATTNNSTTGTFAAQVGPTVTPVPPSNTYPPTTGTVTITAAQVVQALQGVGDTAVSCTAQDVTLYVCAVFSSGGRAAASIPLQVLVPEPPTGVSVSPGDSALRVSWTASGGTVSATFYDAIAVAVDPTQDGATHESGNITGTSARVDGLKNNVAYNVTVVALSSGRNRSAPSAAVQGTPIPVQDFWQQYKAAGGHETGGCSAGGAGVASLLAVVALLARRRRA